MGIGTKGVHVSELKYKTCPARWIYFCVGVFPGSMSDLLPEHVNVKISTRLPMRGFIPRGLR